MTTEQLLKPRYKVIADYPFSPFKIGEIHTVGDMESCIVITEGMDNYPHLFRKLEWWEDREVSEIEAVQYLSGISDGAFYKVDKYALKHDCVYINEEIEELRYYAPATLSDYTAYINQTKPTI